MFFVQLHLPSICLHEIVKILNIPSKSYTLDLARGLDFVSCWSRCYF